MKNQENGLPIGFENVETMKRELTVAAALEIRCPSVSEKLAVFKEQLLVAQFVRDTGVCYDEDK